MLNDLVLGPCLCCQAPMMAPALFDDDTCLAITCGACRARGSLYVVHGPDCIEAVARRAARDWNLISPPPAQPPVPAAKQDTTAEKARTDKPASPVRSRPQGRKNGAETTTRVVGGEAQAPNPQVGESGKGADPRHGSVRRRLLNWLQRSGKSVNKCKLERIDLGVSTESIRRFLDPSTHSKASTIDSIVAALDRLEAKPTAPKPPQPKLDPVRGGKLFAKTSTSLIKPKAPASTYPDSKVVRLTTNWAPDRGLNLIPNLNARPARCASTP